MPKSYLVNPLFFCDWGARGGGESQWQALAALPAARLPLLRLHVSPFRWLATQHSYRASWLQWATMP